jgi:hypothetical protein
MRSSPDHPHKPKLTDAERHKRFEETAKKVEASEDSADFERAFGQIVSSTKLTKTPVSRK